MNGVDRYAKTGRSPGFRILEPLNFHLHLFTDIVTCFFTKDLTFSLQYGMIYYNMLLFPPCAGSSRKSRKDIIMEIERKFLVMTPPENYESFPCHEIEQAYLCTEPVVRVRKEDDTCYLTYKSKGLLAREEYNLPLTKEAYAHLLTKADGNVLTKKRYLLPVPGREDLTVEFDIFEGKFAGLMLAEIEFSSEEDAKAFPPLPWFDRDVTWSGEYQNSKLSKMP
mgnify:FL=1